jgi:hypothetical protein
MHESMGIGLGWEDGSQGHPIRAILVADPGDFLNFTPELS